MSEIIHGLSDLQAKEHLKKYGLNVLVQKSRFSYIIDFFSLFFSPLVLLLLGASFVSAVLGDITDFLIIVGIVIVSGTVTFWQHFKAENTAEKLKQKVHLTATVIRNNVQKEIPFSHVTVGDVIVLGVGDIIPADGELIEARDLSIDESSLTGESFPAEKDLDQGKKIFLGTHVVTGEGKAVITTVGKASSLGKLSKELVSTKPVTAFDKGISNFSFLVVRAILALTIIVFLINAVLHHNILQAFLFAVALAVGLTPELLPVMLTINLSKGAIKMEKKEVIVKYLPAIQNLGGMNILCTDKTGTLTENTILLEKSLDGFGKASRLPQIWGFINSHFQTSFRNPLDIALAQSDKSLSTKGYTKIDELPFDFSRKTLSVIAQKGNASSYLLICKGAPLSVFEKITTIQDGTKHRQVTPTLMKSITKLYEDISLQGYRLLAVAYKDIEKKKEYSLRDETGLTLIGFLVFTDPVKNGVHQTLQEMSHAGIAVKILTGDNEFVTSHVCQKVGLVAKEILLGHEIDGLSDTDLSEKAKHTTIFARLSPEQKSRVIVALKSTGAIVGYLGDGINDAPPLKASDVGISVKNGSDIARDVADIVLMRKSLSVLREGVIEGRKTHVNILKYIMMEISSNFGNMITLAGASLILPFLPMLPVQILLNNFLYDMSQLPLPTDTVDEEAIARPRGWNIHFIKNFMLLFGPISSLFDFLTFFVLLNILHASAPLFRTGWFIESFVTQTLIIFAIRTKVVPFFRSIPGKWVMIGSGSVLILGLGLANSQLGRYVSFVPLPFLFYALLVVTLILYFCVVETAKVWFYKQHTLSEV